jgi:hypothetical protein
MNNLSNRLGHNSRQHYPHISSDGHSFNATSMIHFVPNQDKGHKDPFKKKHKRDIFPLPEQTTNITSFQSLDPNEVMIRRSWDGWNDLSSRPTQVAEKIEDHEVRKGQAATTGMQRLFSQHHDSRQLRFNDPDMNKEVKHNHERSDYLAETTKGLGSKRNSHDMTVAIIAPVPMTASKSFEIKPSKALLRKSRQAFSNNAPTPSSIPIERESSNEEDKRKKLASRIVNSLVKEGRISPRLLDINMDIMKTMFCEKVIKLKDVKYNKDKTIAEVKGISISDSGFITYDKSSSVTLNSQTEIVGNIHSVQVMTTHSD